MKGSRLNEHSYRVRVTAQNEQSSEVTIQGEHPMEAVVDGLMQIKVESLELVTGIEVDRITETEQTCNVG